ncbi:MAG: tyrosine-protein phosphatase [Tyzzerella sp.]|nr:tyrosine-protein phosphatase [Tyzzerella sp.]
MKRCKRFFVVLLCILLALQVVGCENNQNEQKEEYAIKLNNAYDGATVDLCSNLVREYLNATEESKQIELLNRHAGQNAAFQTLSFSWEGDGVSQNYSVYFSDNEAFEDSIVYETTDTHISMIGCFVPGTTYYWKVVGDAEGSTSAVDTFTTLDAPVRYISTLNIPNVRDMGGWETEDGKRVKYELVYRGGKTNPSSGNKCTPEDEELFAEKLGIRTEIDLRTQNADDGNQTSSVFGFNVRYYKTTLTQFCYIYPEFEQTEPFQRSYDSRSKQSIQQIFEVLGNENNYPIYFHCNAGADRTATVAFLINGLLGVSYEDLTKDYELTTFSTSGSRWRSSVTDGKFDSSGVFRDDEGNYVAWGKMYDMMMQNYGTGDGKLSSAIENYLKTVCNVEQETIDSVRKIMLED